MKIDNYIKMNIVMEFKTTLLFGKYLAVNFVNFFNKKN